MRQEAYRDAAVSGKYKLLTAIAISIAIRCAAYKECTSGEKPATEATCCTH